MRRRWSCWRRRPTATSWARAVRTQLSDTLALALACQRPWGAARRDRPAALHCGALLSLCVFCSLALRRAVRTACPCAALAVTWAERLALAANALQPWLKLVASAPPREGRGRHVRQAQRVPPEAGLEARGGVLAGGRRERVQEDEQERRELGALGGAPRRSQSLTCRVHRVGQLLEQGG